MNAIPNASAARGLDRLLAELRPKLHRYCARMVGSAIDGEDVVQDALVKAVESFAAAGPIGNPEGWLFRVAHNTALVFRAPPHPAGSRSIGRGGGHDCRPCRYGRITPGRSRFLA